MPDTAAFGGPDAGLPLDADGKWHGVIDDPGLVTEPATAATDDLVVINRDERGIVHGCPPDGSGLTPCCQRTPFELPRYDRLTIDPKQVTCGE